MRVTGEVASAPDGRKSEQNEAPRSAIAPRSKRVQSRVPQEGMNEVQVPQIFLQIIKNPKPNQKGLIWEVGASDGT